MSSGSIFSHESLSRISRRMLTGRAVLACVFILAGACFLSPGELPAQTKTVTYLENSDHELKIYFINGKEPGKTMMIIGGIQGDEPGGYLAADLYADMLLERGNMIVVPRANFNSIKKNRRGVNGDMNRKFSYNPTEQEDKELYIVDILKSLILKSDILLNLHEGSGFYRPRYYSNTKNPMRYGQSVIADASAYTHPDGKRIELEDIAQRVIAGVNRNIKNAEHFFQFNNHDTLSEYSKHKEQRKSATFFALTEAGISAFGVETSKSITDIETKVKYETLIINAFMTEYGIIPEHPSVFLPLPELEHLVIQIEGYPNPFAVKKGETLRITPGTSIHVTSVVANYKRGLSIDISGVGNMNDLDRVAIIHSPTTINVYKDAYLCGKVNIQLSSPHGKEIIPEIRTNSVGLLTQVQFRVENKNYIVSAGDTLHIVRGDVMVITKAWTANREETGFRINFVGFVGNKLRNDAEDRGYRIDTAHDLMSDWSVDGKIYRVEAQTLPERETIGSVYVAIDEPTIDYLIVERNDGTKLALTPGSVVNCVKHERFKALSVISNITSHPAVDTFIKDGNSYFKRLDFPEVFETSSEIDIEFRRGSHHLGSIAFRISG